VTEKGSRAPH